MDQWLETRQLPVYFVSAAGLVYKDDKVLLIKTQKRGWELPGGVVEPGESILDGLKREISEESIDVDWFAPSEIEEKITDPYIKKAVQDLLEFDGKQHFCTFKKIADGKLRFVSDILV